MKIFKALNAHQRSINRDKDVLINVRNYRYKNLMKMAINCK